MEKRGTLRSLAVYRASGDEVQKIHEPGLFLKQLHDLMVGEAASVKYWRTKAGAEVDFIIDFSGNPLPIECKSLLRKPMITRGFRNFLKQYKPAFGVVVNAGIFQREVFENTPIHFIPYRWLVILGKALFR